MKITKVEKFLAKSGSCKSLVIFLHGYGANGADLISLSEPISNHFPNTVFLSPNAFQPCPGNPMGFQWFPIEWLYGDKSIDVEVEIEESVTHLRNWINSQVTNYGVSPGNTLIVGFSQGTMMALHLTTRGMESFAGVVGFSGKLLKPKELSKKSKVTMPILLVHGTDDEVVPLENLNEASDALLSVGYRTFVHVSKGIGHGIGPDGLSAAIKFMKRFLKD